MSLETTTPASPTDVEPDEALEDDRDETETPDPEETSEPEAPAEPVTAAEGEDVWVAAARPVLTEVAGTYHGLITHTEFAGRLQADTGVRTRSNPSNWIGRVLARVAAEVHAAGEPPLTALVVHGVHGTVGEAYDEVLRLQDADPISDPLAREKHAALARMECYRWADATLPADGGNAALSPRYDMVVTRERKKNREEAQPDICPTCFMAIPPTGECDNCV